MFWNLLIVTAATFLAGCAGGASTESASSQSVQSPAKEARTAAVPQRPVIININQPGDNALTCPQLQTEITKLDEDMLETRQRIQDTGAAQAGSAGASAVMSQMPGGDMLTMFSALQRGADVGMEQGQMNNQDRMQRLEMRRDNLTMTYNMKCRQAAKMPRKKS